MIYYISDMHLGHANAITFDNRPFADVEEMDRTLIDNWNARVQKDDDDVYIVGDFCYKSRYSPDWYLKRLNGHKHLIKGNHDFILLQSEAAMSQLESISQIEQISDGDKKIILCHFPIAEWYGYYRGYWHVYGHIHRGRGDGESDGAKFIRTEERALNAGCMINNYMPVTFNELVVNNKIRNAMP
ncbi:MAG: metallophosphoesterase [Clostridiales bacterium]|nr:metallophosphoesterase [Clostridiales bacterium]